MGDLSGHRDKASKFISLAKQNEEEKQWQDAFDNYTKALDIFTYMLKCKCGKTWSKNNRKRS